MSNNDPTLGLWADTAPPAPPTARLVADVECDIIVIGAGYTGLSAALHAAQAGRRVVVVEAEDIGSGGSGRNVGLVNAGLWTLPDTVRATLGEPHGSRLISQLGEAPTLVYGLIEQHAIECTPVRHGTLHCARDAAGLTELAERARQWQRLGAPVELLDARATASRLGSDYYRGSLLDRRAGTVQPLAYARGLARAATGLGATIYTSSPVTGLADGGDHWQVATPGGRACAPWVIVATNAYSTAPFGTVRTQLVRLPYFNLATPPLGAKERAGILPGGEGIWDTNRVMSSLRLDAAGRIVFGSVGALRRTGATVHGQWARRALARLYPALAGAGFEHRWYGWIGMTVDHVPRLHRLHRNVVSVSGYNGRGIGPGTSFGRDLAALACGGISDADLPLPVTRPMPRSLRHARESWYEIGSLLAHLSDARWRT